MISNKKIIIINLKEAKNKKKMKNRNKCIEWA